LKTNFNILIAMSTTAKALGVIGIIAAGIIAAIVRGFIDMTQNWETGYGPNTKRADWQALALFVAGIVAAILFGIYA
jgi:hypothetical protein